MRLSCVLFDLDGTLLDTTELIIGSLTHALQDYVGRPIPRQEIVDLIGRPLVEQMRVYAPEEDVPGLSARCLEYYEAHRDREVLYDGALDVLDLCRELGLDVGIVTSKNRREILGVFDRLPLLERVDTYVCSEDTSRPKPFPDPVNLARARLGAPAEQTLFVGDSVYDIRCGKAAGVRTAAVLWGPNPAAVLEPEDPTFLLPAMDDLRRLLVSCHAGAGGEPHAVSPR